MILLPLVLLALGLLGAAGTAAADEPYPTRPVSIVVPFPPGGIASWAGTPPSGPRSRRWPIPHKVQTPIADQDADEFKAWWDHDARLLADVVTRIGRVESK
jgi:hypothetical protein